jgi:hypothetical protein
VLLFWQAVVGSGASQQPLHYTTDSGRGAGARPSPSPSLFPTAAGGLAVGLTTFTGTEDEWLRRLTPGKPIG